MKPFSNCDMIGTYILKVVDDKGIKKYSGFHVFGTGPRWDIRKFSNCTMKGLKLSVLWYENEVREFEGNDDYELPIYFLTKHYSEEESEEVTA